MPWTRKFPDGFFRRIFEIQGWQYEAGSAEPAPWIGQLINGFVYEQLPPNVLDELRHASIVVDSEYRPVQDSERLIAETGNRRLDCQITALTAILRVSEGEEELKKNLLRAYPNVKQLRIPESRPVNTNEDRPPRYIKL